MDTNNENNVDMLQYVYKNTKMGVDSINSLLPRVKDENLRQDLTFQLSVYQNFATLASDKLEAMHAKVKKVNPISEISAKAGIAMNTIIDDSPSHLAEMMINGSNMGIIDMTKKVKEFSNAKCCDDVIKLGNDVITFEQQNIEKIKTYL